MTKEYTFEEIENLTKTIRWPSGHFQEANPNKLRALEIWYQQRQAVALEAIAALLVKEPL